jgi:hypothetical protein
MNGLRHGARMAAPLAGAEDSAEFRSHRRAYLAELAPADPAERMLAEEVILQAWRLNRVQWMEARLIDRDLAEAEGLLPPDGGQASESDRRIEESICRGEVLRKSLGGPKSPYLLLLRLEARLEQFWRHAMAELRQYQAQRGDRQAAEESRRTANKKGERPNPTSCDGPAMGVIPLNAAQTATYLPESRGGSLRFAPGKRTQNVDENDTVCSPTDGRVPWLDASQLAAPEGGRQATFPQAGAFHVVCPNSGQTTAPSTIHGLGGSRQAVSACPGPAGFLT